MSEEAPDPIPPEPPVPWPEDPAAVPFVLPVIADDVVPPYALAVPRPGLWGSVLWCLAFLGATQVVPAIVVAVVLIAVTLARPGGLELLGQPAGAKQLQADAMLPMMIAAQLFSWGFSLAVIRWLVGRDWTRRLALRLPPLTHLALVALAVPALIVLSGGYVEIARKILPNLESLGVPDVAKMVEEFAAWPWPIAVLVIGLGPAIGEELWCRGFLGRGLVGRYGVVAGVLLTSFFFGLIHIDPVQGSFAMLFGLALHYAYLTTRSLWAPILMHFLNNSFAVTIGQSAVAKQIDDSVAMRPLVVYLAAGLLVATVGWALYRSRGRLESPGEFLSPWQPPFPGVEYPPPEGGTVVVWPRLGAGAVMAVLVAVGLFAAAVAWV